MRFQREIPALSIQDLGPRTLARPSVMTFMRDLRRYRAAGERALDAAAKGLGPLVTRSYPLTDVARAHAELEAGAITDCAVLVCA